MIFGDNLGWEGLLLFQFPGFVEILSIIQGSLETGLNKGCCLLPCVGVGFPSGELPPGANPQTPLLHT